MFRRSSSEAHYGVCNHLHKANRTSSKQQRGNIETLYVLGSLAVSLDGQVETAKTVTSQTVCSTLEQYGIWSEIFHNFVDDWLKDVDERLVVESFIKWEVDGMILPSILADIFDVPCSREIVFEFVETACHHSISEVECLFDSISMMNVNIDI